MPEVFTSLLQFSRSLLGYPSSSGLFSMIHTLGRAHTGTRKVTLILLLLLLLLMQELSDARPLADCTTGPPSTVLYCVLGGHPPRLGPAQAVTLCYESGIPNLDLGYLGKLSRVTVAVALPLAVPVTVAVALPLPLPL